MNPCKFLDTEIINNKGNIKTEDFRKTSKLPGFQNGTRGMF